MEPTKTDREFIARLRAAIEDPGTPSDKRQELRDELGDILMSYVTADHLEDDGDLGGAILEARQGRPDPKRTNKAAAELRPSHDPPRVDHGDVFMDGLQTDHGGPARLQAWLVEKMQPEPQRCLDREDPAVVELSELAADREHAAMMFCQERNAEKAMLKAGFLALWGLPGAATLPF